MKARGTSESLDLAVRLGEGALEAVEVESADTPPLTEEPAHSYITPTMRAPSHAVPNLTQQTGGLKLALIV